MSTLSRTTLFKVSFEHLAGPVPKSTMSELFFKSTQQIANKLVALKVLRREHVLQIQHLDPKWMTAIYMRAVCLGVIIGYRPIYD